MTTDLARTQDSNGNYQWLLTQDVSPANLLALSDLLTKNYAQIQADAGTTPTPPVPPTPPAPPPVPNPITLKPATGGKIPIFVFSGGNSATYATNPAIAGTSIEFPWCLLEPSAGTLLTKQIDDAIKPWRDAGKQVTLRCPAVGWKGWGPPYSPGNAWFPDWVTKQGVPTITCSDGTVKPQYWHPKFIAAYSDFINALAAQYNNDPSILFVPICIGDGGETKCDTKNDSNRLKLWQKIGYTDDLWWGYIQQIVAVYQKAFSNKPLVIMPDATFIGGNYGMSKVMELAVAQKIGVQDNGVVKGEVLKDPNWKKVPFIIAEQRNKTTASGDTLEQDFQQALADNAAVFMIFKADLDIADPKILTKYGC